MDDAAGRAGERSAALRVRWMGRVPYREALAVQTALFEHGREQHLLLLEHPHVFTHGARSDLSVNLRCDPAAVGAELVPVKRGGDITYHGPGQLVGYPILNVDNRLGAAAHVCQVEGLVIDALAELGLPNAGRLAGFTGVWLHGDGAADDPDDPDGRVAPRKICAIGVRLKNGRTRPSVATALAIAGALGVDVDAVFPPHETWQGRSVPRRRPPRSATVGGAGVGDAAVGSALIAHHHRPAEVNRER